MIVNSNWSKVSRVENYTPQLKKINLIDKNTKVILMGSCFADEMGMALFKKNINVVHDEVDLKSDLIKYPYGTFFNPANFFEILELTFNETYKQFFSDDTFILVNKDHKGNHFENTDLTNPENQKLFNLFLKGRFTSDNYDQAKLEIKSKLEALKKGIIDSDVVVITLGLIETWIDKYNNATWHAFSGNPVKRRSYKDRAYFRLLNYEDVEILLKKIIRIIGTNKKIIFTLSPIPLKYTFTNKEVVCANAYSKSVLRTVLEKFIDDKNIFYYPAYEIVKDCVGINAYTDDFRHIKIDVFNKIIAPHFFKYFSNFND